ncbi:MAG: hypothetical protein JWL79_2520 [Frankiales bacterium]|jgi:hypothetical protein|nr:hypothetical protein [Frankiales bacterium]
MRQAGYFGQRPVTPVGSVSLLYLGDTQAARLTVEGAWS